MGINDTPDAGWLRTMAHIQLGPAHEKWLLECDDEDDETEQLIVQRDEARKWAADMRRMLSEEVHMDTGFVFPWEDDDE